LHRRGAARHRDSALRGVHQCAQGAQRPRCDGTIRRHDAGGADQRRAGHADRGGVTDPHTRSLNHPLLSRIVSMPENQLFATKSLPRLLAEMEGDNRLRRVLGPVTLTALGIGAVIGAGIFVATGEAAHKVAGPALMVSYMAAGITCIFAALCYAEFASMAPVAGSAYTYAYTTMGELFAWIIGWDLVLEYAVGAAAVAHGWSSYFVKVLDKIALAMPETLRDLFVLPETLRGSALKFTEDPNSLMGGYFESTASVINLPAV